MKIQRKWLGFLLLLLAAVWSPQPLPTAVAQGGSEQEILRLVNALRSSYGLPPFVWNGQLAAAAQNQANYMAANNIYSHTGAGGSSPQSRANAAGFRGRATENIVGGTNLSPGQGVIWWQNSPVHFNTLISPQYSQVGIASATGFDQNFYALVAGQPGDQAGASLGTPARVLDDAALAPVTPIQLAAPREDGSIVHTVGSGQSFWAIAARYEVPLEQLYLFNNLTEDSVINPGDELTIRLAEGQLPPPTPTPPATHRVREGDSWWTIAALFRLTVDDILWLNSAKEDSLLSPGDEVRIRLLPGEAPPPTATPQVMHTVRDGDTAWSIATNYGLPLDDLLAYNNLGPNPLLRIGDQLLVVAPTALPSPTPLPTALPPTATAAPTLTATATQSALTMVVAATPAAEPDIPAPITEPVFAFGNLPLWAGAATMLLGLVAIIVVWRRL